MVASHRLGRRMRISSTVTAVVVALVCAVIPPPVTAHTSMTVPLSISYTTDCRVGGPRNAFRNCPGPCPNVMLRTHGVGSSPQEPAATYHRGQTVTVRWARNNHEGGFVRWALVPVTRMNDPVAHEHFAFRWGCWSAGRFVCSAENRRKLCIDDRLDEEWAQAFSEHMEVPKVVPDGDYVLSFAWYGGVRDNMPLRRPVLSSFGDYYDCSYVRISGGAPLEATAHRPFNTGIGTRFADRCVSSVNSLGKCVVEPCTEDGTASGESRFTGGEMVPKEFTNGTTPPPLTSGMYLDLPQRLPQSPPTVSPTPEPTPTPSPSPTLSPSPAKRRLWVGIKGFYVVDTRGVRADTLSMSAVNTVSRSHYPKGFTIEASTKGNVKVQSVAFLVNKAHVRTERFPRWSLTGDRKYYWAPWRGYKKGHLMRVRAKPWAKRATKSYARTVQIRVVD